LRVINFDDHIAHELVRASYIPQRRWLRRATFCLGLLAGLTVPITLMAALGLWPVLVVGALAVLCGTAWACFEWRYRSLGGQRDQLQAGLAGQRLLPQFLSSLDDGYYLVNNLKLPGRADDVDHIVVGPNGVFALETKHHRGRIFWRDGQWYQSKMSRRGHLQPEAPVRDPTRQLKRNVDYLRTCINRTDLELSRRTRLWIEGAVVFTHPAVSLDLPHEVLTNLPFPVLRARDLPAHITRHVPRHPHSKAEVRQVVSLMGHLESP
jgi:hypothetical protein